MSSANTPKKTYNVYTVMLIVSCILMFFACVMMGMEMASS